jgi:hypothetical protein
MPFNTGLPLLLRMLELLPCMLVPAAFCRNAVLVALHQSSCVQHSCWRICRFFHYALLPFATGADVHAAAHARPVCS